MWYGVGRFCLFIKQKTAYERRISDWSSDVCSSDLPMARDVRDCAIMLENMAGFDPKDATSLNMAVPNWEAALSSDLKGKMVGIPKEYRLEGIDPDIDAMWDSGIAMLKDAGARTEEDKSELQSLMRIS